MRRIVLFLVVTLFMVAMMVASAMSAFAQANVDHNPTCFQGTTDTSDNCILVESPSGNNLIVNRNPDGPKGDPTFVSNDPTGCTINRDPCTDSHFTATPSGKDIGIAHQLPHKP